MRICASCGCNLDVLRSSGYSGLYNPDGPPIELCQSCFFDEDGLIEEAGTNDLPDELARYRRVLEKIKMPYDGDERGWSQPPRHRPFYVVRALGQRNKRKIWRIEILWPGMTASNWWPLVSFYADNRKAAYFYASYFMQDFLL